jgi:hypothetical protein
MLVMSDTSHVKALRLDNDILARIEMHRQRMQRMIGRALEVTEGAAMRDLLLRGLASVEGASGPATADAAEDVADVAGVREAPRAGEAPRASSVPIPPSAGTPETPAHPDLAEEVLEMLTGVQYDAAKYKLGKLCSRGHDYEGTGQSLLYRHNSVCVTCDREKVTERRRAKRKQG